MAVAGLPFKLPSMTAFSRGTGPISSESIIEAINDLIGLAKHDLPIVLASDAPRYRLYVAGLFARTLTVAEAIVHLTSLQRPADLMVLGRALYEHVVMLAWIAAPKDASRVAIWELHDNEQRLKFDADLAEMRGQGALSARNRERMQAARDEGGKSRMPPLHIRAEQADHDWSHRVPFEGLASMRGGYATSFRGGSTVAHPTLVGLNNVWERAGDHIVVMIEPTADIGPVLGPVVTYLAIALLVASDTLGVSSVQEINEVMDSLAVAGGLTHDDS